MNDIHEHQETIDTLFGGTLEWDEVEPDIAYIPCPGSPRHTGKTRRKDCRVYFRGAISVYCVHDSCEEEVAELTENVRGALKSAGYETPEPTVEQREAASVKASLAQKSEWIGRQKEFIFQNNAWDVVAAHEAKTGRAAFEEFLTTLFEPEDILWMGRPFDSGMPFHSRFFKSVEDRLQRPPDQRDKFLGANPFKPGTFARRDKTITTPKYFVIEGDTCHADPEENKRRCGAIFRYAMQQRPDLKLRAVVDAGNKSLHGWFDYPTKPTTYDFCTQVLPALGADPKTMRLSQPVRCPGVRRENGKDQTLLWIS